MFSMIDPPLIPLKKAFEASFVKTPLDSSLQGQRPSVGACSPRCSAWEPSRIPSAAGRELF